MNEYVRRVEQAASYLKTRCDQWPATAIVLGTGLSDVADRLRHSEVIDTADIPGFPDQSGRRRSIHLHLGTLGGRNVAVLDGRLHLYDGYSPREITFYVRLLAIAGTTSMIQCCAAGGISPELEVADIAIVRDQINLTGSNPLEGPNHPGWGPRFPDMSTVFSPDLAEIVQGASESTDRPLKEGIYAGVSGPNLETAAEYRMLERLGADIVGMSLVHEVIVARHMGIDVLALAVITDVCRPDDLAHLSISGIIEASKKASPRLAGLLETVCASIRG